MKQTDLLRCGLFQSRYSNCMRARKQVARCFAWLPAALALKTESVQPYTPVVLVIYCRMPLSQRAPFLAGLCIFHLPSLYTLPAKKIVRLHVSWPDPLCSGVLSFFQLVARTSFLNDPFLRESKRKGLMDGGTELICICVRKKCAK
jgi:hypothetical protein